MFKGWSDKKKIIVAVVAIVLVVVIYHRKDIAKFLKNRRSGEERSGASDSTCSESVQDAKFGCGGSVSNAANGIIPEVVPARINLY